MRCTQSPTTSARVARRRRRAGSILVWCAFLLIILIAMVGLVIDGGLMLANYRESQNAADAAALAAAMDLMLGKTSAEATATATTIVTGEDYNNYYNAAHTYRNLEGATVVVNIPPTEGPYVGSTHYAEAFVTYPFTTRFMPLLWGFNPNRTVRARAVAGFEPISIDEGVIALDPGARPGIAVNGNGTLWVNGKIQINASADRYAATTGEHAFMYGTDIEVVGNVDSPTHFLNADPSNPTSPLQTKGMPDPDIFSHLPTPTVANGVVATNFGKVSITGGTTTLNPGVYDSLAISGTGTTVTFNPGIYVIKGGSLTLTGGNVTGNGVMFYVTGKDYNPTTGAPDISDPRDPMNQLPPGNPGSNFGDVTINAAMHFSPIDTTNPLYHYANPDINNFNGMLFYQRRADKAPVRIEGNSAAGNLTGTIYAKWAPFDIAGQGIYSAQFVVGSMKVTGNGVVTVNYIGRQLGKAPQVFLVE